MIKGSERITGWVPGAGSVWRATVPNALFGDFNPFAEEVVGDWIVYRPGEPRKHLGDVYLNGRQLLRGLLAGRGDDPPLRTEAIDDWTGVTDPIRDPEQTQHVWYAEVGADETTIWANFQGADPNSELVEINVRPAVFFPTEHHLDYITVRGFELCQAACPWTPPTADQPGLIGPNWAKGWIIEDNDIHDAKCSAISIGKESSTGHNYATLRGDKPGYQYQLESVFSARQIGWDREHIGSHVIRGNTIHDCGQNGIVGHLGCVFSTIEDNHIYNIAIKREFYGYEIGGIKLHAAIDVTIRHNRIHDCTLGTWLDWQTQGTRISRNLFHDNNRDLFVEVSHGPYLVEHNILASPAALELWSQGGAFVHNLICGTVRLEVGDGPGHAVPPPAQHPGRRLRVHRRRRRPLGRQLVRRRRRRDRVRPRPGGRRRRRSPGPPVTTATRPRSRNTWRASRLNRRATTSGSWMLSSPCTPTATCTPPPLSRSPARTAPWSFPPRPSRSSSRATRSIWRRTCPLSSTASASNPSPAETSSGSVSPTPTSRSPTALRRSWTST